MTTTIIAGHFQEQAQVDDMIEELQRAGFQRERIASFYVNPAGQHDAFPIGGDRALSPGAKETDKGVAAGAVAGAAVGVAATPFLGPVGAGVGGLVGAHIGGLVGGLSQMKEKGETGDSAEESENTVPVRKSGMMVAVAVDAQEEENQAINALRAAGAGDIERAEGTIQNGDWIDFDPVSAPTLLHTSSGLPRTEAPPRRL
jgi:hypothetical protein